MSNPTNLLDFTIEYIRSDIDLLGNEEDGMATWLGEMYLCIEEWRFDDYERLLRAAKTFDLTSRGRGQFYLGSGDFHYQKRNWEIAKRAYLLALDFFRQTEKRDDQAIVLTNLALTLQEQGNYDQAVDLYQQAEQIYRSLGDQQGLGQVLSNIGSVADQRGSWPMAVAYYQQSLQVFEQIPANDDWERVANNLGVAYENSGQWEQAEVMYIQCVDKLDEAGQSYSQSGVRILSGLGNLYARRENWDKAVACLRSALDICIEMDNLYSESFTWNNLGTIYTHQGEHKQALECYQKHLSLVQQIGDRQGIVLGLSNLGSTYEDLGELQSAETCFLNSLQLSQEMDDAYGVARAHNNLGVLYEKRLDASHALESYRKGTDVLAAIGNRYREVVALTNIATLFARLMQLEDAEHYIQRAWEISLERRYADHLAGLCMLKGDIAFLDLPSYSAGYRWYSQACQYAAEYSLQLVDDLARQVQLHMERMVAHSQRQEAIEFSRAIRGAWILYSLDQHRPDFLDWLTGWKGEQGL